MSKPRKMGQSMTGRVIEDLQEIQERNRRGWRLAAIYEDYVAMGFTVTFAGFLKALRVARNPSKYRKYPGRHHQEKKPVVQGRSPGQAPSEPPAQASGDERAKYFQRPNLFKKL